MKQNNFDLSKTVFSGVLLAVGFVLPFITMYIPAIGNMLLPMHIPVMLCGFICGWPYGTVVGFILPLLRSVLVGMPVMFPNAEAMAFELAAYGFMTGFLYQKMRKNTLSLYFSLIAAMIFGRVIWAMVSVVLYSAMGNVFVWEIFLAQGIINALPGICIQLILIPATVKRMYEMQLVKMPYGE